MTSKQLSNFEESEKIKLERDTLKNELYVLTKNHKLLEQTLEILKKDSDTKRNVDEILLVAQRKQLQDLETKLLSLKYRVSNLSYQLPHIILAVWKLLSEKSNESLDKRVFANNKEKAVEYIVERFHTTILDAERIYCLIHEWSFHF